MLQYYKTTFLSNSIPAPTWKPVSSPDVPDYAQITDSGVHMGQGLLKERCEFWESLPVTTGQPGTSEKDEL
jgi:hypothetical protein